MSPRAEVLHKALRILNAALESNSRKISALFQSVELLLAETLPTGLLNHLDEGSSPVTFFSDLPLEWTLLDNWPVDVALAIMFFRLGQYTACSILLALWG